MRRALVTGGAGFIGSNLALRLAQDGVEVVVVDSLEPGCGGNPENLREGGSRIRLIQADIGEPMSFADGIRHADVIFNLAGEVSHSRSMSDPERDLRINTTSQLRFLLACRELRPGVRIVYAGTRQVYGRPDALPVSETHPIRPVDFNGVHKYAATQYHLMLASYGELDAVVLRLSNIYGPRMALQQPQQGFLGVFLQRALDGQPITVFGDGSQLRDPLHVDDAVEAFVLAGTQAAVRSRTLNIGGAAALSLKGIAEILSGGRPVSAIPFPPHLSSIDIGSYATDLTLARRELGWNPAVDFATGAAATLAWYRQRKRA